MKSWHLLWQNEHDLLLYKPAGLAVELTTDTRQHSLLAQLQQTFPAPHQPKLPYRLDRVTRGLVLVALTPESIAFYNEQIRNRNWCKWYVAKVWQHSQQEMTNLLGKHKVYLRSNGRKTQVVRSGGKVAWLEIQYVEPTEQPQQWYVLIQLLTGRYHQIRAMCAHLGIPLVGDWLYGKQADAESSFYLEHIALAYPDYATRSWKSAFWAENSEREPISQQCLTALLNQLENARK